jgi:hypothetical protein
VRLLKTSVIIRPGLLRISSDIAITNARKANKRIEIEAKHASQERTCVCALGFCRNRKIELGTKHNHQLIRIARGLEIDPRVRSAAAAAVFLHE